VKSRPGKPSRAKSSSRTTPPASDRPQDSGGEIVELSRFRAELGRGRRLRRADALLEAPSPRQAVRALPGDEFYYVLHELGFPEASEILQYATPEQVQTALDFAIWDRDQLAPAQVDEWLSHLVEAPPSVLSAWARGLDVELLALLIRQRARIYDLSQGEEPDDSIGTVFNTPDGFFALELMGDVEQQRVTRALCDLLYRMDRDFMRRILVGARAELDSELEELAYRWRSGRMADLGFESYYDALEVYREIDPASVRLGETAAPRVRPLGDETEGAFLRVPAALAERLAGGSPFARAVAGINDKDELANLQAALVTLSNRVLAADRITPGDDAAVEATLNRLAATLDLAIEFLGRARAEDGVQAVRTVPLVRIFQVGVSLTGKMRRLANTLKKQNPFARRQPPIDLFELEDDEVLAACGRLRPMFPRALETPPAAGERPFAALADLALATAAIERAGAAIALAAALGATPEAVARRAEEGGEGLDTGVLGRTLLVRRWLGEPAELAPPSAAGLQKLQDNLKKASANPERRAAFAAELVRGVPAAALPGPAAPAATAVLGRWIEGLVSGAPLLAEP
jgi:Family of unknown function (DUF6178)